jgi:tetratricopeptide (TPR) repeat protein
MIPREGAWTVIFSRDATSWGSFFYDEKDDALRIEVTPQPNEMRELLTYDFTDVAPDAATLRLEWEKLAVPMRISVDNKAVVLPRIRRQLNGLPHYTSEAWDDAARYMLDQGWELDEALRYADQSLAQEETFPNLLTKAELLQKLGRNDEARTAFDKAIRSADALHVHAYARQLQAQGPEQAAQALQLFEANAAAHPDVWVTHAGLARIYSARHDFEHAAKEMKLALAAAPEKQKPGVQKQLEQLQAGKDIN